MNLVQIDAEPSGHLISWGVRLLVDVAVSGPFVSEPAAGLGVRATVLLGQEADSVSGAASDGFAPQDLLLTHFSGRIMSGELV